MNVCTRGLFASCGDDWVVGDMLIRYHMRMIGVCVCVQKFARNMLGNVSGTRTGCSLSLVGHPISPHTRLDGEIPEIPNDFWTCKGARIPPRPPCGVFGREAPSQVQV
jgi:hypothetical protein